MSITADLESNLKVTYGKGPVICWKKTNATENLKETYCTITWVLAFEVLLSGDEIRNKLLRVSNTMEIAPKMILDRRKQKIHLGLECVTSSNLEVH